ncbi:hypothetical protein OG984_07900 [Nocardioides sp. NBC_00368]
MAYDTVLPVRADHLGRGTSGLRGGVGAGVRLTGCPEHRQLVEAVAVGEDPIDAQVVAQPGER